MSENTTISEINDKEKNISDKNIDINAQESSKSNKNKNKKKKKPDIAKNDPQKTKGKSKNQSAMGKRLAEAQQEFLKEQERQRKEQEEKERKEEEARQKEAELQLLAEEKKAKEIQKKKERRLKLKKEGKLLSKTQQKKKSKNNESLKQMLEAEHFKVSEAPHKELETQTEEPSQEKRNEMILNEIDNLQSELSRIDIKNDVNEDETCSSCDLRSPIVCVMGHVDTGKTKILDKLRNTHVQAGEAGGITQQIGVTNVPISIINERIKYLPIMKNIRLRLCGLAIIDTPGHFSFQNLRSLGSSLCDIAILIVDLMHSIEPQTLESLKLLQEKKTLFVVALNKIDLITGWKSFPALNIEEALKQQSKPTKAHFNDLYKETFTKFAELEINLCLAWNKGDNKKFVPAIPTSAKTGDGVNDLMAYICRLSQEKLENRLKFTEEFQATVMEVKVIPGLGSTIDVILVNGKLNKGDRIVVPGFSGPIVSQIRALLTPPPMREMRVKSSYTHHESISLCQGIKISGPNLDEAIAGLPMFVVHNDDDVDKYKNILITYLEKAFSSFKKSDKGVYVHASTLGSLEALLHFLRESKIPYFGFQLGPVHKKDVITTMTMLEHDPLYGVIMAFDVKVESDAQIIANKNGVKIFTANIIYHLLDQYVDFQKMYKKQKADENRSKAIFPCILKIIPENVYKTRDPIIVGVKIEEGSVRIGTPICVPTKENIFIGVIQSVEINHKSVEIGLKGQEVCIKITNHDKKAPKLLGRHFEITDKLVSQITRESIDVLKDFFRDDMKKDDWLLIKHLKSIFSII